jgi:2'-5' RNA ligase
MRCIIALLAELPNLFIEEAQAQFSRIAEGYLLSNDSLPHVTLAQFYLDNENELKKIWDELQTQVVTMPQPRFTGIGFTQKAKNLWGVSLSVARDSELLNLHCVVVDALQKHTIQPLNDSKELYRPHLTLARIREPKLDNFNVTLLQATPFVFALGQADENGQYLKSIFKRDHVTN